MCGFEGWYCTSSSTEEFSWYADVSPGRAPGPDRLQFDRLGIHLRVNDIKELEELRVSGWTIAFFTAILPMWLVARSLRHEHKPGCCIKCGYDLRATPDRCPECGSLKNPKEAAAGAADRVA